MSLNAFEQRCKQLILLGNHASLEELIINTAQKDCWHRRIAIFYLGKHPLAKQAVPTLVNALHDTNNYVVHMAAKCLSGLHLFELHDIFIQMLSSEDFDLKYIAIEAIAGFEKKEDFSLILQIYLDKNLPNYLIKHAAYSLLYLVSKSTWHELFALFSEAEEFTKLLACKIALRFASIEDEKNIIKLTKDTHLEVRMLAYKVVHTIRNESLEPVTLPAVRQQQPYKVTKYPLDNTKRAIYYNLCEDQELNDRVSTLLNTAYTAYTEDTQGAWKNSFKEECVSQLVKEIKANQWLAPRLLKIKDRLVSMLVYQALKKR